MLLGDALQFKFVYIATLNTLHELKNKKVVLDNHLELHELTLYLMDYDRRM